MRKLKLPKYDHIWPMELCSENFKEQKYKNCIILSHFSVS